MLVETDCKWLQGGRPVKLFRGSNAPKLISVRPNYCDNRVHSVQLCNICLFFNLSQLIKAEFETELMCMEVFRTVFH